MNDQLLAHLHAARTAGEPCVLVTIAATRGSVPRAAGAKMLVFADGTAVGTIGGGKFESLVLGEALAALHAEAPLLKTYPLHEDDPCSFGAICGGEVTIFLEPLAARERLVLVGAGHCAQAVARLALDCGWHVTVLDDRSELLTDFPKVQRHLSDCTAADFIARNEWRPRDALVLVSRNFELDRDALAAGLRQPKIGYVGMIGSRRKVRRVFEELSAAGFTAERLARVFAPIGLDIGSDSPAEIAVSVVAEILKTVRGRTGLSLHAAGQPLS